MPIGAIVGGAAISAGGSAIAGGKNAAAIDKSTEAQAQANRESLALQREVYGKNTANLSPYMERGNAAGSAINALLGLGGGSATGGGSSAGALSAFTPDGSGTGASYYGALPEQGSSVGGALSVNHQLSPWQAQQNATNGTVTIPQGVNWQNYIDSQPDVKFDYGLQGQGMTPEQFGVWHWQRDGARRDLTDPVGGAPGQTQVGGAPTQTPQEAAAAAFDAYKSSTGYTFRVAEGNRALNSGWAGSGSLKSGAAGKAFVNYGQNAASAEFSNYMGLLANQQSVGAGSASALAGVGQSFANNVTSLNSANANAAQNAAIASANNSNATIGNITGALTGALGKIKW